MVYLLIIAALLFPAIRRALSRRFLQKIKRIEPTKNKRYYIVHHAGKCGVYDHSAGSFVTGLEYDALTYISRSDEQPVITVWMFEKGGDVGLLSVAEDTNKAAAFILPEQQEICDEDETDIQTI